MESLEVKKKKRIKYEDLLDIEKIKLMYYLIRKNTRNKAKLFKFEMFFGSNIVNIYNLLKNKTYTHSKYNVFLITRPKCRIIMSESMVDKIINHLLSKYVLFPLIEPKLIDTNVATRKNKGTKAALASIKKYINKLKTNHEEIYVLKIDISKFFYTIDHEILLNKLEKIIEDKEIYNLIKNIVINTNEAYVNTNIKKLIIKNKKYIDTLNISNKEKQKKIEELDKIPLYKKGKGLPIGNMTSQILAIFYLNDLDHIVKEQLQAKYYIRYMDDMIILHHDKQFLIKCMNRIIYEVDKLKLKTNDKTQIYNLNKGLPFLGYKFILKNKRLHILLSSVTKKRIKKRLNKVKSNNTKRLDIINNYNGYLKIADCRQLKKLLITIYK